MITAFVDENAMSALAGLKTESDNSSKQNITIEFIDAAPLTAEVTYNNDEAEITIYVRDEMHTNGNIAFQATVNSAGIISSDEETVEVAYAVSEGINQILKEKGKLEECTNLDDEMQGVLFAVDKNDDITVRIVEGKKRPSLLCTTLFGAPRMMRPYTDEIMNQFEMDSMSFEEMEEAANEGDSDAMEQLAMAYLNGNDEIEENPEKAYYWFVKCAESGNDQAMFNVGLFTAKGFGTERDFGKAAEWMQKAADEGDEDAEVCAEEYKKLASAVEKANAGEAQAQADLAAGLMKLGGSLDQAGEGKDYEESVKWAEKAVAQGNADGYWTLALAYHHGRGVKKDINKAIELYQKGSEAGSDSCKHNLACEYMSGENIKKDQKKAFVLIKEAAENGYGLAMRDLGRCYQFANGTPGNMKKAVEWYEKALEVIDDPELAQKTAMFKMMADADSDFGEDYPESDEEDDLDLENLPKDYLEALEAVKTEIEEENCESTDEECEDDTISEEEGAELSKEEAMDALKSGQGVLKQVVTKADGTKKEVAIWGGYELDGYDRTLNVFMNQSDIGRFVKMITEEEINVDGILDPCEQEIGYQVTVDFMDCAAMCVMRKGEGKLSMEMYVRDERKTCQTVVEVGTGEIELTEDGNMSLDKETLENNKFLVYAIGFAGLRKYLLKERIVHKLYSMYDESAGVLVKVSKGGTITTRIVKGMERPDLPCEVFLLGEQICRPYLDELLGLKSTGVRKPRDPEFAAKLKKFEEEAQKKEEEEKKRKAEEEKKRKEKEAEEKRKKAEEEKARKIKEEAEKKAKEEARISEEKEAYEKIKRELPEKRAYYKYASGIMGAAMKAFACVKPDGTVASYCDYLVIGKGTPGNTSRFSNIKKIVCTQDGVIGLKNDGTCIATVPGFTYAYINECNTWRNIIDISAGDHQVIGLRADGTCIGNTIKWNTGYGYDGQSDVSGWRDIIQVACSNNHTIGLRKDGSVVLACTSSYCKVKSVTNWKNVEMIATDHNGAVGLTKDGQLLSAGTAVTDGIQVNKGIVQLTVCCGIVYALYCDGTVGSGKREKMRSYNIRENNVIALKDELRTLYVLTEDGQVKIYGGDSWSKVPSNIKVFDSYDRVMRERAEEEKRKKEEEALKFERRNQGKCQHCGGELKKGFFSTKCLSCGKNKDY